MLEKLVLKNVGPAPEMSLEFAPRVNIITGDNGLGKSFILDVAWWALTQKWFSELNSESFDIKHPPPNGVNNDDSKIYSRVSLHSLTEILENKTTYDYSAQKWVQEGGSVSAGFVIFTGINGDFAVRDSSRITTFRFNHEQLWDGLQIKQKKLSNVGC